MSQAQTAGEIAVVRFTKGSDKGQVFELREELVHFGRGEENHFKLSDSALEDHELSIMLRNGRYAIYAARDEAVAVDGNQLPAEKWVWLPEQAIINLGGTTEFEFKFSGSGGNAEKAERSTSPGTVQPKSMPLPIPKGKPNRKAGKESVRKTAAGQRPNKAVARFITDSVGDPLVKLGEDGHLPELSLDEHAGEGRKKKKQEAGSGGGNSMLLYLAIGFSFISSTLMLVLDLGDSSSGGINKSEARREIQQFYGGEKGDFDDYQILLREAALVHSRQDYRTERDYYRRVMRMLTAEDNQGFIRLTDTKQSDEKLRELLAVLLAN